MLEYFTYKKVKKHNADKKDRVSNSNTPLASPTPASPTTSSKPRHLNTVKSPSADLGRGGASPILNEEDEYFLHRFISAEGTPPPLPQRKPTLPARPSERGNEGITMGDEAGEWRNNELQIILREDEDGEGLEREIETQAQGKGKEKIGEGGEKIDDNTEKVAKKWKKLSFLHRGKKVCYSNHLILLYSINQQPTTNIFFPGKGRQSYRSSTRSQHLRHRSSTRTRRSISSPRRSLSNGFQQPRIFSFPRFHSPRSKIHLYSQRSHKRCSNRLR